MQAHKVHTQPLCRLVWPLPPPHKAAFAEFLSNIQVSFNDLEQSEQQGGCTTQNRDNLHNCFDLNMRHSYPFAKRSFSCKNYAGGMRGETIQFLAPLERHLAQRGGEATDSKLIPQADGNDFPKYGAATGSLPIPMRPAIYSTTDDTWPDETGSSPPIVQLRY